MHSNTAIVAFHSHFQLLTLQLWSVWRFTYSTSFMKFSA